MLNNKAIALMLLICMLLVLSMQIRIHEQVKKINDLDEVNRQTHSKNVSLENKNEVISKDLEEYSTIIDELKTSIETMPEVVVPEIVENLDYLSDVINFRTDRFNELNDTYKIKDNTSVFLLPLENSLVTRTTKESFARVYSVLHNNMGDRWCLIRVLEEESFRWGFEYGYVKIKDLEEIDTSLDLVQYESNLPLDIDRITIGDKYEKTYSMYEMPYAVIAFDFPFESIFFSDEADDNVVESLLEETYAAPYEIFIRYDYNVLNSRINL